MLKAAAKAAAAGWAAAAAAEAEAVAEFGMLARSFAAAIRSLFSESPARAPPREVMYSVNQGQSECTSSLE